MKAPAGARRTSSPRPRRSPTRRCRSSSCSPASFARRRSTTSASRRRSPATSRSSAAAARSTRLRGRSGDCSGTPARRAARRLPGRPGGALERRPALGRRARRTSASARDGRPRRAHGRRRRRRASRFDAGGPRARDRRACASGRCSSVATCEVESRPDVGHAGRPHGAARPADTEATRWKPSSTSGARDDEGPDRRRPRDRPLGPADAARAPDGHRGDRRGLRRRRGPRHGDPRATRPGDPRREDAEAHRACRRRARSARRPPTWRC